MMISKNIPGVLKNQSTKNLLDMGNKLFNRQILNIKSPKDRFGIAKALSNELMYRMYENEKTTYPFDKETITEIEKNYKPLGKEWHKRKEEIKQRIAFENLSNPENEITDLTLSELYQLIKDLEDSGQILNEYNFYIPDEIGAELIKIVCEDNQNNINEIAEIIYTETQMKNPTFDHTKKLFQKYYDDYEKKRKFENDTKQVSDLIDLQSIVDSIISNTIRHNFKQKSSTKNYTPSEFLPQVLSRKVADFLQFDYTKHFNEFCKIEDSIKKKEPIHRYVFETVELAYGRRWLCYNDLQGENGIPKTPRQRYNETRVKHFNLVDVITSKSYKGEKLSEKQLEKLKICQVAIRENITNGLASFKTFTDKEIEIIKKVFEDDTSILVECFNALNGSIYSDNANIIIHNLGLKKYDYFPKQYFADDSRDITDPLDALKRERHFFMQMDILIWHFGLIYPEIIPPIKTEYQSFYGELQKRCKEQKTSHVQFVLPNEIHNTNLRMHNRRSLISENGEPDLPTTFEVIENALEQMQGTEIKLAENKKPTDNDSKNETTNENLQYKGIGIYKILDHLKKNKFSKANHRIYVLHRLKILEVVLENCDTHEDRYNKLIELDIINNITTLNRVQKIITLKNSVKEKDYPFKSCAKKIDKILEEQLSIILPK